MVALPEVAKVAEAAEVAEVVEVEEVAEAVEVEEAAELNKTEVAKAEVPVARKVVDLVFSPPSSKTEQECEHVD